MHSLILLNVFKMSDKSITLMRSRLGYFYLRIHFCPLTKIIKMDSSADYQQFLPAPLIFTALSLSRSYFVKYLLSVLFFVHKHHPGNSTPTQHFTSPIVHILHGFLETLLYLGIVAMLHYLGGHQTQSFGLLLRILRNSLGFSCGVMIS